MRVREDAIRRQDGSQGIYGVVEKFDFVVIAPVEDDGSVHLVEQYRYPVAAASGNCPRAPGSMLPEPIRSTWREANLLEETGLVAGEIDRCGASIQAYGERDRGERCILDAQAAGRRARKLDQEEQGLITRRFPRAMLAQMIREGKSKMRRQWRRWVCSS